MKYLLLLFLFNYCEARNFENLWSGKLVQISTSASCQNTNSLFIVVERNRDYLKACIPHIMLNKAQGLIGREVIIDYSSSLCDSGFSVCDTVVSIKKL